MTGQKKSKSGTSYRDAGVDIDAQDEALRRIASMVRRTRTPGVLADLGSFGGLFAPDWSRWREPVLVSSCDGVGTKLKVAFMTGIHNTVGRDLVNHCVNDILVQGAEPMFFMDYVATGRLEPGVLASVVEGVAAACEEAGCALLGGETAEMPGFYGDDEYDIAGFVIGIVDRDRLIDGSAVREGHVLLGLPSTGLHTNGFSLARRIFFTTAGLSPESRVASLGCTVGEELLRVHRSYLGALREPVRRGEIAGMAHITGGGLTDNLPRVLPAGLSARVERGSWPVLPVFRYLQETGDVDREEMYRAFNMGIGMVLIVAPERVDSVRRHLESLGETPHTIGTVVTGDGEVIYA